MISRAVDHIAIAVDDMDQAAALWQRLLQIDLGPTKKMPEHGASVCIIPTEPKVELIAPLGEDSNLQKFLLTKGPGLHHVAFVTEDLPKKIFELKQDGFDVLGDPRPGYDGRDIVFCHPKTTGSVLIEWISASR